MAAALQRSASLGNPNPNPSPRLPRATAMLAVTRLSTLSAARFCARPTRGSTMAPGLQPSIQTPICGSCLRGCQLVLVRRLPNHVTFAAPQEDPMHNDGKSEEDELGIKTKEALEAWKQMLESFKEEAIKMQGVSQEAYAIYSKRAMELIKETSENMKIQADQARHDLSKLASVIGEEGKEYLSIASKNSPESMKDIVDTFASPGEWKDVSDVRDFFLGIPYGSFLVIGGFLHFMLTGSVSGIRFGIILGATLLALSVSSLRAWKSGQSSHVFLKGQAAITAIIFVREWNLLFQRLSVPSLFTTFISGAMLAFYIYRMIVDGQSKGPSLKQTPEN